MIAIVAAVALATALLPVERLPLTPVRQCAESRCIELNDLSARFLAFFEAARSEADEERRFALWQAHYGFAAVPPGPQGEALARQLLRQAWSRYPAALPVIRRGAQPIGAEALATMVRIADLLGDREPIDVKLLAYVGGFEDNAFSYAHGGRPVVAVPIETSPQQRSLLLAHELTHAVHLKTAKLSGGWERSIAQTIIQEGLATHVARQVAPGQPLVAYLEHTPGWWNAAEAKRSAILKAILPVLEKSDGETVFRFTIGPGPNGLEREAYAAGWYVIEDLLAQGMSLAEIARIPEERMASVVRSSIERLLSRIGEGGAQSAGR